MRTTEDALRSFKRYLALALDQPVPPLAAAKFFPDPETFDPNHSYPSGESCVGSFHVWFDLNPDGVLDAAPVSSGTGFVSMGRWNGFQMWGNPPGKRWHPGSSSFVVASPDVSSASPGLVAGLMGASPSAWAQLLGAPRWGIVPPTVLSDGDQPYRVAMLTEMPASIATELEGAVAADELTVPPTWDVRFFHDAGEIAYPACVVKPVGPVTLAPHVAYMEMTQAFVVYAYPSRPNDAAGDASGVQIKSERIRNQLATALVGTVNRNGARPMRLPLYDYDGVPADQPAGRRLDSDYLKVVDASVDSMPEPTDLKLTVVIADVRLNWRVSLEDVRGTSVVEEFRLDLIER